MAIKTCPIGGLIESVTPGRDDSPAVSTKSSVASPAGASTAAASDTSFDDAQGRCPAKMSESNPDTQRIAETARSISEQDVAQKLCDASSVVVLTGAGVSQESGIPTYRGENGYWVEKSQHYRPQQIYHWDVFNRDPQVVWDSYASFAGDFKKAKPNAGHYALVELEELVEQDSKGDFTLVTQNIDGLHVTAGSNPSRVFEIHGRVDELRCDEKVPGSCLQNVDLDYPWNYAQARSTVVSIPTIDDSKVSRYSDGSKWLGDSKWLGRRKCYSCGTRMRPNVMFFDERYNECFYSAVSARVAFKSLNSSSSGVLLVIGTQNGIGLAHHMVKNALAAGVTVIKIDIEIDVLDRKLAGMHVLQAKSGEVLPRIISAMRRILLARKSAMLTPCTPSPIRILSTPSPMKSWASQDEDECKAPSNAMAKSHEAFECNGEASLTPITPSQFNAVAVDGDGVDDHFRVGVPRIAVQYDWVQWEEHPDLAAVEYTVAEECILGFNTDGDKRGSVFVESVRPGTWAARQRIKAPCKIVSVNGLSSQSLPQQVFNSMMQRRPVTFKLRSLRLNPLLSSLAHRNPVTFKLATSPTQAPQKLFEGCSHAPTEHARQRSRSRNGPSVCKTSRPSTRMHDADGGANGSQSKMHRVEKRDEATMQGERKLTVVAEALQCGLRFVKSPEPRAGSRNPL